MGRGVSTPTTAVVVTYRELIDYNTWEEDYGDEGPSDLDYEHEYESLVDWIREECQRRWPSLEVVDRWLDREDRAVLENEYCHIGLSTYCGTVAIWIAEKETTTCHWADQFVSNFGPHWIASIGPKFEETFGQLRLLGRFSNGESAYQRVG